MTDRFADTDEPGVNEMSLTTVAPQPFPATEETTNARVSALAGWVPLPVALLVPLPAMSGHLTSPMASHNRKWYQQCHGQRNPAGQRGHPGVPG